MPRPRSARSDTSDADMEGLQEQELVKLQRQYRLMEGDRAAYTEESQNIIRKQKWVREREEREITVWETEGDRERD